MIAGELAAAAFGLAAAFFWGTGDFSGGLASRRAPLFTVALTAQAAGLVILLALALLIAEPLPSHESLVWAVLAGLAGSAGLALLYHALTVGQMGVAAPVTALVAATIPVLVGATTEGPPAPLRLAGFALALAGIAILSQTGSAPRTLRGVGWAFLAGTVVGLFVVLLSWAGRESLFWPIAVARMSAVAEMLALALFSGHGLRLPGRIAPIAILSGASDVAGNLFFVVAAQAGRLDVAAVLSSLYPASTILLARFILGERLTPLQMVGVATVLAAIVLIVV